MRLTDEVATALAEKRPVVALESTIVAHGLPWPENFEVGRTLEAVVREHGAVPATIAIVSGQIHVGLAAADMEAMAAAKGTWKKTGAADLALRMARREHGATTVSATAYVAARAGISVFATGGIGGVHRGPSPRHGLALRAQGRPGPSPRHGLALRAQGRPGPSPRHGLALRAQGRPGPSPRHGLALRAQGRPDGADVSSDLTTLGKTRICVVSAGMKAILDLPATMEVLETLGVPVIGYRTDELPAFYTRTSGIALEHRVESADEAALVLHHHFALHDGGVLLVNPVPESAALAPALVESAIEAALADADAKDIRGKAITPHLLAYVAVATNKRSLVANRALAIANAELAAEVARALVALS